MQRRRVELVTGGGPAAGSPRRPCAGREGGGGLVRALVAVLLALGVLVLAGPAAPAGAGEEWCESDPVVLVTTPQGNVVAVYVLTGAQGLEHVPAVLAAEYRYTAAAAAGGASTLVDLDVLVPADGAAAAFATRSAASTGPLQTGTGLAGATGWSGQPMRLRFELAVP